MSVRELAAYLFACLIPLTASAGPAVVDVFSSKSEGYPSIRIPSLIVTRSGTLLAFAEGRARPRDQAENKIILKRSTDLGRTWSALQVVMDDGQRSLNNPCAVVDAKTGRVLLMVQSYPSTYAEFNRKLPDGVSGEDIVKSCLLTSDDEGRTWSRPQDITAQVKRPEKVPTVASGPGIGIQLKHGAHAGRILMPFNEGPPLLWRVYAAISDDGGKTWRMGQTAPDAGARDKNGRWLSTVNEVQFVELSDGSVRLNTRHWSSRPFRRTAVSHDGGETWSDVTQVPELNEPSCQASILRYPDPKRNLILYSGPKGTRRSHGALFFSEDDGATWKPGATLYPGGFAYSCLAALPDGSVGVLFERDNYAHVSFMRLSLQEALKP